MPRAEAIKRLVDVASLEVRQIVAAAVLESSVERTDEVGHVQELANQLRPHYEESRFLTACRAATLEAANLGQLATFAPLFEEMKRARDAVWEDAHTKPDFNFDTPSVVRWNHAIGAILALLPAIGANTPKLFSNGVPSNSDVVDLIARLDAEAGSGKSATTIAREFTGETTGRAKDAKRAQSLLSQVRRVKRPAKANR